MTNDWHTRALVAEQKLADAKRELELFYDPHVFSDVAIAALHRLKVVLGVDVPRKRGLDGKLPDDKLTVVVDYQLEKRPSTP